MKLLPNGKYQLTKRELVALLRDSEELNCLYYNKYGKYGKSACSYLEKRARELNFMYSRGSDYDLDIIVAAIIDKMEVK